MSRHDWKNQLFVTPTLSKSSSHFLSQLPFTLSFVDTTVYSCNDKKLSFVVMLLNCIIGENNAASLNLKTCWESWFHKFPQVITMKFNGHFRIEIYVLYVRYVYTMVFLIYLNTLQEQDDPYFYSTQLYITNALYYLYKNDFNTGCDFFFMK